MRQADLLTISESDGTPEIDLRHGRMLLRLRPGTDEPKRQFILEA